MPLPRILALLSLALVAACKQTPDEPEPARAKTETPAAATSSAPPPAPPVPPDSRAFVDAMNAFCVITQQVNGDASIAKEKRATEIVKRLLAESPPPAFLEFVTSLGDLPSGARYQALKKAAAERGAPAWSCPALAE